MGIPDDEVEAAGDDDDDADAFKLWPENEHALKCFMLVRRLWRVGPMGGVLGLDYQQVEAKLRMRKVKVDMALLDDLDVMELGMMAGGVMVDGAVDTLNAK